MSCRFFVGLFAATTLANAQTAPTSDIDQTPAATSALDDEVLTLDVFTVAGEQASGYRATNAITATGIGTKISEVPLAISVVTSELMQDASHFEMREALNFVPGVLTNPRSESAVTIRGFGGLISYRNGQYRRQLMTTWNMDRIEVIKGPSAIFFGAVRPGGIVNNVTMKPVFSGNFTDVKLTGGSEDFMQGEVYTNQVINEKLAIRAGAGLTSVHGERQFEYRDENYVGFSAIWKPTGNQQLTLDLEAINREVFYLTSYPVRALANSLVYGQSGAIAAQEGINRQTTTADSANRAYLTSLGYSGTSTDENFYPLYDMFAPYDYHVSLSHDAKQLQRSQSADLDYLVRINEHLVWQTTLNYGFDNTSGLQPSDGEVRPYADGSVRFRTEKFINIRDSFNVHNKLTWRFNLGSSRHTVQAGHEFLRVIFTRPGYLDPSNRYVDSPGNTGSSATNPYVTHFTPGVSAPVSVNDVFDASGQDFSVTRKRWEDNTGYFIVDQATLFDDRLSVLLGARYNKFKGKVRYNRPISNSSRSSAEGGLANYDVVGAKGAWTPQAGVLFKVFPGVAAFATYSESVEPNFQLDADGVESEPVSSSSFDIGVKIEGLGGRITSTIAYYDIDRENLAYRDTTREIATGRSPFFIFGNGESTQGYETELNFAITDNYTVIGGWSHVAGAETTKSNKPSFVGRRFGGIPPNTYFLWNRYTFTEGAVKGVTLSAGMRHNDGTNLSADPNNAVRLPGFTVFDTMASYTFKVGERDYTAQFNVKNLTDKRYREGSDGYFGQARTFFLSLRTRF